MDETDEGVGMDLLVFIRLQHVITRGATHRRSFFVDCLAPKRMRTIVQRSNKEKTRNTIVMQLDGQQRKQKRQEP